MALTFFCIYQGFVLFRATTFAMAAAMMHQLCGCRPPGPVVSHPYGYGLFWAIVVASPCSPRRLRPWWERVSLRVPRPGTGL